jgi:hypothetical protein
VTTIRRLVGVYDADHTVWGELRYFVGARLGRSHCALCDITHGLVRERDDWKTSRAGLPAPFDTFHRDDQPDAIRAATAGIVPAVVAETAAGVVMLLGPSELDACAGSSERLVAAIDAAVQRAGLGWPAG